MDGKWKLEALALLTREVEDLREASNAADFALEEAQARAKAANRAWHTADDLLDKLREHIDQTTPTAEGGAA